MNLKKVVRSMLTLKARVKHLEGSLFDLRETLLELEEDMHYERGIFSNFIRAELKSQIFLVAILFGLASYYTSEGGIAGAFKKTHLKQLFVFSFCAIIYLIVWVCSPYPGTADCASVHGTFEEFDYLPTCVCAFFFF